MARAELQIVRDRLGPILLIILIGVSKLPANTNRLYGIAFETKQNGLIVEFEFEKPMSPDSISAWQAGSEWFYFTLSWMNNFYQLGAREICPRMYLNSKVIFAKIIFQK